MKGKGFALLTIGAMLLAATGLGASKVEVEIEDYAFVPQTVTIQEGDTVEWKNLGAVNHTSTSGEPDNPAGIWDSGTLAPGETYSRVFTDEGTYPYYCAFHPAMLGEVVVDTTDVPVMEETASIPSLRLELGQETVRFSLPRTGAVTLTIYDVLGNQAAVLTRGVYTSGSYEIPLTPLDSGIYFVRLTASQGKITRKLIQIS